MSRTPTATRTCPECGGAAPPDARFCEACGADLPLAVTPPEAGAAAAQAADLGPEPDDGGSGTTPPSPTNRPDTCRECGGEVDLDRYCTVCGAKAPSPRDHVVERSHTWVAGVSDRGVRHRRNEDAVAVAAGEEPGGRAVLVVCDGVSTARDSDVASLAAARASCSVLITSRAQGLGTDVARIAVLGARLSEAAEAAARAVAQVSAASGGESPPSCTWVAAVVEGDRIVAGVVGDSRAYWLPDEGEPQVLTADDSWAAELIAAGIPREEAETGRQAHAITRWLGIDSPDQKARVTTAVVTSPGWLLVCSDGLWNYCSPADELAALVRRTAADTHGEPLATASALVDWANAQGGHDNITVALARLGGAPAAPEPHTADGEDRDG